jgi:hypothetical protein
MMCYSCSDAELFFLFFMTTAYRELKEGAGEVFFGFVRS